MSCFDTVLNFVDELWEKTDVVFLLAAKLLGMLFYPLILMGPTVAITGILLLTILFSRWLSARTEPERLKKLQSEFEHWLGVRKAALKVEMLEDQGKGLAKAVDKSYLDDIYIKMYIESTCWNGLTKYVPILVMLLWITHRFDTPNLLSQYGKDYVLKLPFTLGAAGNTLGAFGWSLTSLALCYLGLWILGKDYLKNMMKRSNAKNGLQINQER
ncbi:MAG: hypothetical protein P1P89_16565 [Desulfobacterales bacterium]|nr:hypothetical protein [Desulfobacterales bacterium]